MGFQFPDAAMSGKPMKASYINDLRNKVNIARGQQGRTPINWGPDLNSGDVIRASQLNVLRDAIRDLWLIKDLIDQPSEFPGYANGQPATLSAMFAGQTSDNRLWLNEAQSRPTVQGITSLCHAPASSPNSYVTTDWVQDVQNLEPVESKRISAVRCLVTKAGTGFAPTPAQVTNVVADFNKYRSPGPGLLGFTVFAMLNIETFDNAKPINSPLTNSPVISSNEYIDGFTLNGVYND
ncbi:MAG: hypothetical protein ACKVVP_13190 [Chloroflexota bacterium]